MAPENEASDMATPNYFHSCHICKTWTSIRNPLPSAQSRHPQSANYAATTAPNAFRYSSIIWKCADPRCKKNNTIKLKRLPMVKEMQEKVIKFLLLHIALYKCERCNTICEPESKKIWLFVQPLFLKPQESIRGILKKPVESKRTEKIDAQVVEDTKKTDRPEPAAPSQKKAKAEGKQLKLIMVEQMEAKKYPMRIVKSRPKIPARHLLKITIRPKALDHRKPATKSFPKETTLANLSSLILDRGNLDIGGGFCVVLLFLSGLIPFSGMFAKHK
ncbi:hypothetical protein RUND412_001775 [Rhizina undulata]